MTQEKKNVCFLISKEDYQRVNNLIAARMLKGEKNTLTALCRIALLEYLQRNEAKQ